MKSPLALWSLILFYLLISVGPKADIHQVMQTDDCQQSCLSIDLNEVDHGQMSLRTKANSQFTSTPSPLMWNLVSLTVEDFLDQNQNFYFLDMPPYSTHLKELLHPPISLS